MSSMKRIIDSYFIHHYSFLLGLCFGFGFFFSIYITQLTNNRNPTHRFTDKEQYNWLKVQVLIRNSLILIAQAQTVPDLILKNAEQATSPAIVNGSCHISSVQVCVASNDFLKTEADKSSYPVYKTI